MLQAISKDKITAAGPRARRFGRAGWTGQPDDNLDASAMSAIPCLLLLALAAGAPGLTRAASTDCRCEPAAAPVCGSDGATYGSKCLLDCARAGSQRPGLSAAHEGPCAAASRGTAARDAASAIACFNACMAEFGRGCQCGPSDRQCLLACANGRARCGCACAALVPSGPAAAGPDQAVPGQALEALLTIKVASPAVGGGLGSSGMRGDASHVAACINEQVTFINSCFKSCQNVTSCLNSCLSTGLTRVCSCPTSSPTPQSPTGAIADFDTCQGVCAAESNRCMQSSCANLDNSCSAACARTYSSCVCACTEALKKAAPDISAGAAAAPPPVNSVTVGTSLLRTLSSASLRGAANDLIKCGNAAVQEGAACRSKCTTLGCKLECAVTTGEGVCRCGAAGLGLGRPLLLVLAVSALAWASAPA